MRKIWNTIRGALIFSIIMLVICGLVYPLVVTGISQLLFPSQANGSLIEVDGKQYASSIVGQDVQDARLFQGRPSAVNYNTYSEEAKEDGSYAGVASGSNNYANSNPALEERLEETIKAFMERNPGVERKDIPLDLITQSGSGLDPHISPEAAQIQIPAIAKASGLSEAQLEEIVKEHTKQKTLGVFGEVTVNYVECNLDIAQAIGMI